MMETSGPIQPTYENWALFAVCTAAFKAGEASPELFFPDRKEKGGRLQEEEARDYCLACPAADFCLQAVLNNGSTYGVEGGLTGPERAKAVKELGGRAATLAEVADIRQRFMKRLSPKVRAEQQRALTA